MEATLGFCLILACTDAANATLHFAALPSYEVCRAGCVASQAEYSEFCNAVPFTDWYCSHLSVSMREARDFAYRKWDAWHWAAELRRWPPHCPRTLDEYENRLKLLIGEENYSRGVLPWPISWR